MISILSTNSGIFDLKMDFLTFAWAKPYEIVLQFFDKIFRIPQQISHLMIPILWAPLDAEKVTNEKLAKIGFTGVKITWVMVKSKKYP